MRFVATAQEKFSRNSERELNRADPGAEVRRRFPDGVFLLETALSRTAFLSALRRSPPVFTRHIQPVEVDFPVPDCEPAPLGIAAKAAALLDESVRGEKVAVQVRQTPGEKTFSDFAVKERLDPLIEGAGAEPAVKDPDWILSVFVDKKNTTVFAGLSAPSDNLNPWSGGKVRLTKDPEGVSRAENKLLEALRLGFLTLRPGQRALDLGAAPGGWTRILRREGCSVTAVDPAALDPRLCALDKVVHVRCDAARFTPKGSYDLITDDMNWEAFRSARTLKRLSRALKPRGAFLLTVKLGKEDPAVLLPKITRLLSPELQVSGMRQLYHNRGEVTVWGIKTPAAAND